MRDKTIVLGVSGGIAAYKACELASRLVQDGATVHAVLTEAATHFVSPLTFQALTHQPVLSMWAGDTTGEAAGMPHIALADAADVVLIAPASADIIARLAHGLADDLLTTLVLATAAPVLVAPAMNPRMLSHPVTQRNLQTLGEIGYKIIEPESGRMACEHIGSGRLPATEMLLQALQTALSTSTLLAGQRVLITAGPTREAIDPVRYISNRSSGRMGYALAEAAAAAGAQVTLVSGPTALTPPAGVELIGVTTTAEMHDAVLARCAATDIMIAAAAPADYAVLQPSSTKLKKAGSGFTLQLEETLDIVAAVAHHTPRPRLVVGFAAETGDPVPEAQRKLASKQLDAIVANDITAAGAGFDVETNQVHWVTVNTVEEWPLLSKKEVAERIINKMPGLLDKFNLHPN